jgi:hypothetical protein
MPFSHTIGASAVRRKDDNAKIGHADQSCPLAAVNAHPATTPHDAVVVRPRAAGVRGA